MNNSVGNGVIKVKIIFDRGWGKLLGLRNEEEFVFPLRQTSHPASMDKL